MERTTSGTITLLTVISALSICINVYFLKLSTTILMIIVMIYTLIIYISSLCKHAILNNTVSMISSIDFKEMLLDALLSFLLFAGALHTNCTQLKVQRYPILIFPTIGVLVSAFWFHNIREDISVETGLLFTHLTNTGSFNYSVWLKSKTCPEVR